MSSKDRVEPLDPEFAEDPYLPDKEEIEYDLNDIKLELFDTEHCHWVYDEIVIEAYKLGYQRCIQNDHRTRT